MTADTLRHAAQAMRERAQAATPGPWWAAVGQGPKRRKQQYALVGRADMRGQGEAGCIAVLSGLHNPRADDAEHIASWHPAVALAMARVFIDAAHYIEWSEANGYVGHTPLIESLTEAATTYLGETP